MGTEKDTLQLGPIEPPKSSRLRLVINLALILLVILVAARTPTLQVMGRWLIVEDAAEKAEIMVVLGGGPVVRGMAAADYYQRGLAPMVVLMRPDVERPDLLGNLDIDQTGAWGLTRLLLTAHGVPPSAIVNDSGFVDSTEDEANRIKLFVEARKVKSLILVTSKYHSRRAAMIFRDVLGPEVKVISLPSSYDPFDPDTWWTSRPQAKRVVLEYQKLAFYRVQSLFD